MIKAVAYFMKEREEMQCGLFGEKTEHKVVSANETLVKKKK